MNGLPLTVESRKITANLGYEEAGACFFAVQTS